MCMHDRASMMVCETLGKCEVASAMAELVLDRAPAAFRSWYVDQKGL